jgi:hypothetical protein
MNTKTFSDLARQELGEIPAQLLLCMTNEQLDGAHKRWRRLRRRVLPFAINGQVVMVPRAKAARFAEAILVDRRLVEHHQTYNMAKAVAGAVFAVVDKAAEIRASRESTPPSQAQPNSTQLNTKPRGLG